jgi:hypothetical protein
MPVPVPVFVTMNAAEAATAESLYGNDRPPPLCQTRPEPSVPSTLPLDAVPEADSLSWVTPWLATPSGEAEVPVPVSVPSWVTWLSPVPELFSASSPSRKAISIVDGSCEPLATVEPKAMTRPEPEVTSTLRRAFSVDRVGNSLAKLFCTCSHWRTV